MATPFGADEQLVADAMRLGGHESGEEAVAAALREYVHRRQHVDPLDRFETIDVEFNDDHPRTLPPKD